MAEIVDQSGKVHDVASNSKANAGLTTGIIGTSLAGLLTLGGLSGIGGLLGRPVCGCSQANDMTNEDLYLERKVADNYINVTKEYYNGQLSTQKELANLFFDSYKHNSNSAFMLYKNQRDMFDVATAEQRENYNTLNNRLIEYSFGLYKNQRDEKDALNAKIAELQSKVDVMAAIRPYQDALINAKIDQNALVSDYKLSKRTCRMIEGQLVLPSTPVVSGYTSYNPCNCTTVTTGA